LKILIHGQEAETLAGHVDLTGFIDLYPPSQLAGAVSQSNATPVPAGTAASTSATTAPAAAHP